MQLAGVFLAMALGVSADQIRASKTVDEYRQAVRIMEKALAAAGGPGWLSDLGGLVLRGEGTWDLATRMQGLTWRAPEPYPLEETLVLAADGRMAYEYHTFINPDASEYIRYQYTPGNPLLFVDRLNGSAFWDTETDTGDDSRRYLRTVPPALLTEALEHRESLRLLGSDGGLHRVLYAPDGIAPMTLHVDRSTSRLVQVEYLIEMPHLGDTVVRWTFKDKAGSSLPAGYTVHLGGRLLREVDYRVDRGPRAVDAALQIPDGITVPQPPAESDPEPRGEARPEFRTLADGVYLAPNVRAGFHHLFVEFDDFVAVVDAPTGWYELQQLPARNWAGDVTPGSAAEKLIGIVSEAVPDKPIRYLILTHHHSDHAGGARPFAALGATLVGSEETIELIRHALANEFTLQPDRLTGATVEPEFQVVSETLEISDGARRLQLVDVGENPHANGMLVAWLPEQRILYQADLFEPLPGQFFPNAARVPVMRWFVGWLKDSGLEPDRIYAIHGMARVTEEQLERISAMDAQP